MELKTIKKEYKKLVKKALNAKTDKKRIEYVERLICLSKIQNYELEDGQKYQVMKKVKILKKVEIPGIYFSPYWKKPQELVLTNVGVFINVPRRNKIKVGKKYDVILETWNGLTFIDDPKYLNERFSIY